MKRLETLRPDCRYFKGCVPCKPHKVHGVHCLDCTYYEPIREKILIIKLGAIGDVIRTTPILHRLKKEFPHAELYWLTLTPVVVPKLVDHILDFSPQNVVRLQQTHFDLLINLDKDPEACALTNSISAEEKRGFFLKDGRPWPIDAKSVHKFLTGLFDDMSKENIKSYMQEIFEILGYEFNGEKYILDNFQGRYEWPIDRSKPVIGLNTGCGGRWKSRLWADENWIDLARRLIKMDYEVILLGGEQEHTKNQRLARESKAKYLGHFTLEQFISEVDRCDLVVTAVTMATHIAIGLGKKIVLFNNTFNSEEFELYGLGKILEPEFHCNCYYAPECPNNCMQYIYVDRVVKAAKELLPAK